MSNAMLDAKTLQGKRLTVTALIRAEDVAEPAKSYLGVKLMIVVVRSDGSVKYFENLPAHCRFGTYRWKAAKVSAAIPADAERVFHRSDSNKQAVLSSIPVFAVRFNHDVANCSTSLFVEPCLGASAGRVPYSLNVEWHLLRKSVGNISFTEIPRNTEKILLFNDSYDLGKAPAKSAAVFYNEFDPGAMESCRSAWLPTGGLNAV